MSFSAEPLVVQVGQALPCSGPVSTLMNSPGCIPGHGLAPETVLSSQDEKASAKYDVLHLVWSSRAVLAAFALSPSPYRHTASSPHFVKWRSHPGGLQYSLCIFSGTYE